MTNFCLSLWCYLFLRRVQSLLCTFGKKFTSFFLKKRPQKRASFSSGEGWVIWR